MRVSARNLIFYVTADIVPDLDAEKNPSKILKRLLSIRQITREGFESGW